MSTEREIGAESDLAPRERRASGELGANDAKKDRAALAGRAGWVGAGTLVSRVLGLGRDLVLAASFESRATDLFFVAFTIPNALRQLLAEGAVSSAFVPVLAKVEKEGGAAAAESLYAKMRGAMWLVLIATCALGMLGAPWLCEAFAAGFHARPGAFERTVSLTRWLFPYLLFMGLAALGAGALQSRKRFAIAAFAPGLLNVAMIAGALLAPWLIAPKGIDPLYGLAIAALVGGALQVAAQIPSLRAAGFGRSIRIDLGDPAVREVIRRIGPMAIGLMIYEVDLVLSRRFLSEAGEGANSYFYYAQRLCDFPQGIFSLALATAALPSLSRLAASGEREELGKTAAHAVRLALYVSIPATVAMAGLARPNVIAIFARGRFDAVSVEGTSNALLVLGLGVVLVALVRQLVPLFYALGDTKTPVLVSGLDLLAFIGLALGLRGRLGYLGVCWAVTGSSLVQAALLAFALGKKLPELRFGRDVVPSALRATASGLVALGIARLVLRSWPARHGLLVALVVDAVFLGAYFVGCAWLREPEQAALAAGLSRRLRRRSAR